MYIDIVPNRNSPPAVLLRESIREGKKVRKRTIANLSHLPMADVLELRAAMRAMAQGEKLVPLKQFEIIESKVHGDTDTVLLAMQRLGMASLLSRRRCREADLVMAMIAARICQPRTKLATINWWQDRTLPEELGVAEATEDDLYAAMDWLLEQQGAIQKRLAKRHLTVGGRVLYDLSSSYFEGHCCPLAKRGYSRDGKKGTLQVNYGLLTDDRGCPVAISVYEGNIADPVTLMPEVDRVRSEFGIEEMVLVGDRGMISGKAIEQFKTMGGVEWITALKSDPIRALVEGGALQLDLFDEQNIFELQHEDYPGERLIACCNRELAKRRSRKRDELLAATETGLEAVAARVAAGRLNGAARIGIAVGKIIGKRKMGKHFLLQITDDSFTYERDTQNILREAALDGVYIVRTSLKQEEMDTADCVRSYKTLSRVERAFRTLKSVDLKVRPIHHRLADRVRAHIALCMLAYYVEWHMREAWRPLTFADTELADKQTRDPVAPARRSEAAERKARTKKLPDGTRVHSFRSLLEHYTTIVRNTCRMPGGVEKDASFTVVTTPNDLQCKARELIEAISP